MSKIYQQDFSKATVLKRCMKGAMCSSFCKAPNTTKRQQKNAVPRQIVPSTDKICQEDFPKSFFKALDESR